MDVRWSKSGNASLQSARKTALRRSYRCAAALGAMLVAAAAGVDRAHADDSASGAGAAEEFFWGVVKDSHTAAPFTIYLQQYPNGKHRAEAEARAQALSPSPPERAAEPPPPPTVAMSAPAPSKAPTPVLAAPAPPEQRATAMRGRFYAQGTAALREAPAGDAKTVRTVDAQEALRVDLKSEDGQWYHVSGAHGGWVAVANVVDAKTAEAAAWRRAVRSSREDDLRRYLARFPKGAHADEARAQLAAAEVPPPPATGADAGEGATPEAETAPEAVKKALRQDDRATNDGAEPADGSGSARPLAGAPRREAEGAAAPVVAGVRVSIQDARAEPDDNDLASRVILPGGDVMQRYDAALGMLADGQSKKGEESLKSLISDFPSDPMSVNAHYRLGDLYFEQHDYRRAAEELRSAYDLNPSSPSAPRALYELAVSQAYRGDTGAACSQLKVLSRTYRGMIDGLDEQIGDARREFKCLR